MVSGYLDSNNGFKSIAIAWRLGWGLGGMGATKSPDAHFSRVITSNVRCYYIVDNMRKQFPCFKEVFSVTYR